MQTFPLLSSGSVAQYPLPLSLISPVKVLRFIDGTDQRFSSRGKTLRAWHIQLSALNEAELYALENFFESIGGQNSVFAFPDPYSGELVPNCMLGENFLSTDYLATNFGGTELWVAETNG